MVKPSHQRVPVLLQPLPIPSKPWECISNHIHDTPNDKYDQVIYSGLITTIHWLLAEFLELDNQ